MNGHTNMLLRAFRHRDFRLLWSGAFLSFVGSWVQMVAQGWLVYNLTGSAEKLAIVTFAAMVPLSVLAPFAGSLTDTFDKKKLLNLAQLLLSFSAFYLAWATFHHTITYGQIVVAALFNGFITCFEVPTRQSIVGKVVPREDLRVAIPVNAMTFNLARVIGPVIGALLLTQFGPGACYLINGFSFFCLIFTVSLIKADLSPESREPQPVKDLIMEGMLYTFRNPALKAVFILESTTSALGLFYISLLPAIGAKMLGVDKAGLGSCYTAIGLGAFSSLLLVMGLEAKPYKALTIRISVTCVAIGLLLLSFSRSLLPTLPIFFALGLATIALLNTSNTLFQVLSPERLRGRVIAMHVWAISGIAPIGVLIFGRIAERYSLETALQGGAACVAISAVYAWLTGPTLGTADALALEKSVEV